MTYREKCDARIERTQKMNDAGPISKRFPDVSSIVVDMQHRKKGLRDIIISRTLNYSSGSHAYFHIECLNKDCRDCTEGFDLEQVVSAMIRSHALSREGQLDCRGNGLTSGHVNIAYKVNIQYKTAREIWGK